MAGPLRNDLLPFVVRGEEQTHVDADAEHVDHEEHARRQKWKEREDEIEKDAEMDDNEKHLGNRAPGRVLHRIDKDIEDAVKIE